MDWLLNHLSEVALVILVLDKIVAVTPTKWDDLILTALKAAFGVLKKGK